ncbi:hypothetical protein McpSp1_09720 [Methanocorpusculaceae archaeon Sp1]|uniref:Uncharacterized protein n=1 Tax=Methanorbis furvi TaxID=3028299 RepID=A0AAE4MEL7_9EURY|nr:hypothetical protein [Methanocorpusculaceae archaeon Sp1]MDV0442343.1 hypothetical protein [Methanocorpusculaceae archaeon Ag1]
MPLNFTTTSIQKAAKRVFTVPITNATAFDANIAALKDETNPLGTTANGITTTEEYYKATIAYLNPLGKVLGTIVLTAPTREIYDSVIADILADTAICSAFGENTIADRNNAKDNWYVKLKLRDPTGETYYLTFNREELKIGSYGDDAILAKVDEWADNIQNLN